MSFLDDAAGKVGEIADKASGLLDAATGGQAGGATVAGDLKFVKAESLSDEESNTGGSASPSPDGSDKPVTFDFGIPTEFIHFGKVHADVGKVFAHKSHKPDGAKIPEGHAIMFRDALAREAILLFGFVSSCKVAVKDVTGNRGAIEEIGAMASNLLGGSSKSSKPDPTKLESFINKIKTEAGKINVASIQYKDIHETGKQFHLIRGEYYAFCQTLNEYYLKAPKSEGIGAIGDAIGSAAANIPGVGKIIAVVQRIAFKMMDMYLATFLQLRTNLESTIETSISELSIQAIKGKYKDHKPVYSLWFKKPEAAKTDDDDSSLPDFVKPVTDKAADVKKDAQDKLDDLYDFAGAKSDPEPTPATPNIAKIFAGLKSGNPQADPKILSASDAIFQGLNATLDDIGGVPKFLKKIISEINEANLGLLEETLNRLMAGELAGEINSTALLESGRRHLAKKIADLFGKFVIGMITGGQEDVGLDGGDMFGMKVEKLSAKQLLAKQIDEKLGKYIEPILQMAIGDLAGQLEASRKVAADQKAETMEVLLGRLPWLISLMFRNTFFPMWNLVAEEAFGAVSPPLKSALKEINSVFNKAKDGVDSVSEYKRRGEKLKDDAEKLKDDVSDMNVGTGSDGMKDIDKIRGDIDKGRGDAENETDEGKARREEREKAEQEKNALDDFYKDNDKDKNFPISGRVTDGEGVKVEEEIPSVLPDTDT
jgi:hypothetical protein